MDKVEISIAFSHQLIESRHNGHDGANNPAIPPGCAEAMSKDASSLPPGVDGGGHSTVESPGEDLVSTAHNAVESLALAMFDALRFLPTDVGSGDSLASLAGESNNNRSESETSWEKKVVELANDVKAKAKTANESIAKLPGINKSKEDQIKEIEALEQNSQMIRSRLKEKLKEAEALKLVMDEELDKSSWALLRSVGQS